MRLFANVLCVECIFNAREKALAGDGCENIVVSLGCTAPLFACFHIILAVYRDVCEHIEIMAAA